MRRRNVAVRILWFRAPLNVAVYNVLLGLDRRRDRDRHRRLDVAVHRVSGRSVRPIVHGYLGGRHVADIGVVVLLVVSVLGLELLHRLGCVEAVVVLIELRRFLAIGGRRLREVILYVQRRVR